jgi:hypothetical protein
VIGDELAAALPELQSQSESLMRDMIRAEELGDPVFDPGTGKSTRAVLSTPYAGVARVQAAKEPTDVLTADDHVVVQRYTVSAPLSATGLRPGLVVTVLASEDPDMTGRTLLITAVQGGTFVTSRRFTATDQQ